MGKKIKLGFEKQGITLKLEAILPLKQLKESYKKTQRYQRIKASISELNLVEPLIVYPQESVPGCYILLEGHTRLEIFKELGIPEVHCLISSDDECYTYNQQVNRLTTIQEHFMILKALKNGVSEERIARTLNVNVGTIRNKRNLLQGICPEAINLLKNHSIGQEAIRIIKKVHPLRQVEMVELMIATNNFTGVYAQAMLAATHEKQMLEPDKKKKLAGLHPENIAKIEKDMEKISKEFKMAEANYGTNVLNLVVARGYIGKLLDNVRIVRWLSTNRMDLLAEYQRLMEVDNLEV